MLIFLVLSFLTLSDHNHFVHVTDVGDQLHLLDKGLLVLCLRNDSYEETLFQLTRCVSS